MNKVLAWMVCVVVLTGCASAPVQRGTLIGALSGAIVGTGVGFEISDPKLLGSPKTKASGDIALPKGGSILAGLAIGTVFGAIVGAMVGHRRDEGYETRPPQQPASTPASSENDEAPKTAAERDAQQQAERAPYLRDVRGL